MIFNPKTISFCLATTLLLACGAATNAQQPRARTPTKKPATAKPAPKRTVKPAAPKPAPRPKPAAPRPAPKAADENPPPRPAPPPAPVVPATPKPNAAAPEDTKPNLALEKNPAVLSALELPRKKPADYLQAVLWLIDLDRTELAKPILADLTKLQLTDADRQGLVDQFGSSSMLKLSRTKDLAPEGAAFADACMASAAAATTNSQRIDTLIKQLADPSPDTRILAQHDLAASGPKAATATLQALARETDRNRRAALAAGVTAMHPQVDGMLLAMLDTHDASLRSDVSTILQQLKVPQATPFLSASPASAEQEIVAALFAYAHGRPTATSDEKNQVELWQWSDAMRQLSSVTRPAKDARVIWMSKLAHTLAQLRPDNRDYLRQALVLDWEVAASDPAAQRSAASSQLPVWLDAQLLNNILADALKENYSRAAVVAANALAQRGERSILLTSDGKASPLANAVVSPNCRVRFAALSAIMALDPSSPYPGSSRIPEALAWFAGSGAQRRALVAMPTHAAATDLAGQLAAHGFSAEATNRGRDALNIARNTPDVQAILVDMDIQAPGIREVLYELRANPTTGEVPIAILAGDGRLEAAERLAAEHQRMIAVPRLHSPEVVANTVKELAELSASDSIPDKERAAQAVQAQAWLAKLESGNRPFYTFRRTALLDLGPSRRDARTNLPNQ